jgi:hypothetical protein
MIKTLFALLLVLILHAPGYSQTDFVTITNQTLDVFQVEAHLKKPGVTGAYFMGCTFVYVDGTRTVSGFNLNTIEIPKSIKTIFFENCTFDGTVDNEGDLFINLINAQITTLKLNDGTLYVYDKSDIGVVSTNKESQHFFVEVNNSSVDDLNISSKSVGIQMLSATVDALSVSDSRFTKTLTRSGTTYPQLLNDTKDVLTDLKSLQTSSDSIPFTLATDPILSGYENANVFIRHSSIKSLSFLRCFFENDSSSVVELHNSSIDYLSIKSCSLGVLDLFGSTINTALNLQGSTLHGLNLFSAAIQTNNVRGFTFDKLSEKLVVLNPEEIIRFTRPLLTSRNTDSLIFLNGLKNWEWIEEFNAYNYIEPIPLVDTIRVMSLQPYTGLTDEDIRNNSHFNELMNNYAKLYQIYKSREDIESANACYAEMKDLYTRQTEVKFSDNPTFTNFFRWQLSLLVKVYTNHGTDPAKAITISFWTILFFAVFYFFFPSDWDSSSKAKMIERYKDFAQKNDKGYVRPFLVLSGGILLSFVNALTLSVNAYTTLGFGNIPTHGIARYVCVFQGFIGWFMLSIFSVALINQVLF